ncbi:hypothetical protein SHELI_v1c11520 [Spiroplasma helicoides]|uniref:Uncharacterized protein n=1 Tax=Spiroplasma helicoides TaxID=216938 RepID=A0A1B3SME0_9MOLU|nr:hypothetical protein SHELI_v1c11520 [Spiroplasma helicoides]
MNTLFVRKKTIKTKIKVFINLYFSQLYII